jgi:hypothetical protein
LATAPTRRQGVEGSSCASSSGIRGCAVVARSVPKINDTRLSGGESVLVGARDRGLSLSPCANVRKKTTSEARAPQKLLWAASTIDT